MKSLPWKIKLPPKIETRTPYICIHMLNQQGRIMRVKDDALCVSRRKLQLAASRKKKKKKHARPFEYAIRAKRKKKKGIPKRRVTVTGWLVGPRSKRVVSEFQKLHRNLPELRCNRVKSFETKSRLDVTWLWIVEGGGRWWRPLIEFENRVEYRSRANWRWCTESVRRNFHSVKSLCIVEIAALRCVEFFSFFFPFFSLFFFPPFIHVGAAFTAIYRRTPPSRGGGGGCARTYTRQARNATLGVRFRGRFHA